MYHAKTLNSEKIISQSGFFFGIYSHCGSENISIKKLSQNLFPHFDDTVFWAGDDVPSTGLTNGHCRYPILMPGCGAFEARLVSVDLVKSAEKAGANLASRRKWGFGLGMDFLHDLCSIHQFSPEKRSRLNFCNNSAEHKFCLLVRYIGRVDLFIRCTANNVWLVRILQVPKPDSHVCASC